MRLSINDCQKDALFVRVEGRVPAGSEIEASVDVLRAKARPGRLLPLVLDIRRLEIDALSCARWTRWLSQLEACFSVELEGCPTKLVALSASVTNLLGTARVRSCEAPYFCSHCQRQHVEVIAEHELMSEHLPERSCECCGGTSELDDLESYFEGIKRDHLGEREARAVISADHKNASAFAARVRQVTSEGFVVACHGDNEVHVGATLAVKIVPRHVRAFCATARVYAVDADGARCAFDNMTWRARRRLGAWLDTYRTLPVISGEIRSDNTPRAIAC